MHSPNWISPRTGHDWRDEDVIRAVNWLKSFVPAASMEARLDKARANLLDAQAKWTEGATADAYDPSDTAAWYILQGETFAIDRRFWVPEESARIVPLLTRLGKELDRLRSISGAEERVGRLMTVEKRQPDGGLFELLVGLAYKRRGWTSVEFVPEERGVRRTPDLYVARPRRRWAVECKRLMPSAYARQERERGRDLAAPIHSLSLDLGRSLVVEVGYKKQLREVPDNYLAETVRDAIDGRAFTRWEDEVSVGLARDVDWTLARRVLAHDDVYFGSSRMIELLVGRYAHDADHSITAKWRPSDERPFFAEAVYQASVVSWWSLASTARFQKARHFRSILANAEDQLPSDRPGVVHIGVESRSGEYVDALRHIRNFGEADTFKPTNSRLRWVYCNYFVPEATTQANEAWAMTETVVPYRIGSHRTAWPLPGHLLMMPEDGAREGVHWDGQG